MTYTFGNSVQQFQRFLDTVPWSQVLNVPPEGKHFGVIVTPWCSCPIPWFAITVGIALRSLGARVTFIVNDLVDSLDTGGFSSDVQGILALEQQMPQFSWIRLADQFQGNLTEQERSDISKQAAQTAIWWNRGVLPTESFERNRRHFEVVYMKNGPHVKGMLGTHQFDQLWCPGGMFGNSGLLSYFAKKQGTVFSSYDSDYQFLIVGLDGVACHFPDIGRAMQLAPDYLSVQQLDRVEAEGLRLIMERAQKSDRYIKTNSEDPGAPIQLVGLEASSDSECWDILMPLNVEWDSTALGMHRVFENDADWIVQTVRYVLKETKASIAVRQHPVERMVKDYVPQIGKMLKAMFGQNRRFRFVGCDEPLSTYSLALNARVILPCSSTIGLECAALGKRVVIESRAYYGGCAIRCQANTKEEYFSMIRGALEGSDQVPQEERRAAQRCFFFAVRGSQLYGSFNPHPDPFLKWSASPFDDLMKDSAVQIVLQALIHNIPIPILTIPKHLEPAFPANVQYTLQ